MQGRLITIEGIDGSGKSTQIKYLMADLAETRAVELIREPGGTSIGESIREILLNRDHQEMGLRTELLLFEAARAQLVDQVIKPKLAQGIWLVCDRFFDSTVAYQAYGRGLEPAFIHKLNAFAVSGYRPDLTLYLDLPVDQAVARQVKRSAADRLEGAGQEFMSKVRTGYLELAKKEPARVKLVDASQTVELVRREIKQIVERYQNETSVCNCQ